MTRLRLSEVISDIRTASSRTLEGRDSGTDGVRNLAADIVFLGDVGKEGAIVAAQYAAHPISKAGDRFRMKLTSKLFANPNIMRKFARRSAGTASPEEAAGRITSALDAAVAGTGAVLRPVRQAGVRAIGINPQLQVPGPIRSEDVAPVTTPSTASSIGSVDVTQPLTPDIAPTRTNVPASSIRQRAAQSPAIANALGLRGPTVDLINREYL